MREKRIGTKSSHDHSQVCRLFVIMTIAIGRVFQLIGGDFFVYLSTLSSLYPPTLWRAQTMGLLITLFELFL